MSLNTTLYRCASDRPCPDNLCCDKAGFCSNAADACDRSSGCQSNCKDIPDPHSCKSFRHAMYPDQFKTKTRPLFAPIRSAVNQFNNTAKCNDAPQADYALQPCDLVEAMGGPERCKYCLYYYPHIREALESYDMNALVQPACDSTERQGSPRTATFLAQIRHETNGLTQLYQSLDNGAGAIHMIPAHFQAVAQGIPRLQKAIDNLLPGLHWQNLKDDQGMQRIIGLVMSNPDTAFLTAGWWLVDGASKRLSPECGDLRMAADMGRGNATTDFDATGFMKVSRCIYGSVLADPGIKQRLEYYDEAWKVASKFKAVPLNATTTGSNGEATGDHGSMNPQSQVGETMGSTLSGPLMFLASFFGFTVGMVVLWTTYNSLRRVVYTAAIRKGYLEDVDGEFSDLKQDIESGKPLTRTNGGNTPGQQGGGSAEPERVYIFEEVETDQAGRPTRTASYRISTYSQLGEEIVDSDGTTVCVDSHSGFIKANCNTNNNNNNSLSPPGTPSTFASPTLAAPSPALTPRSLSARMSMAFVDQSHVSYVSLIDPATMQPVLVPVYYSHGAAPVDPRSPRPVSFASMSPALPFQPLSSPMMPSISPGLVRSNSTPCAATSRSPASLPGPPPSVVSAWAQGSIQHSPEQARGDLEPIHERAESEVSSVSEPPLARQPSPASQAIEATVASDDTGRESTVSADDGARRKVQDEELLQQ